MGALNKILPITYVTMLIASLSLAGFPFLSGFYSKDYLLESSYSIFGTYAYLIFFISILSTTISSYYSFRLIFFVFFGEQATPIKTIKKISESSYILYTPLIILAILSIFSGYYLKDLMTLQTSFYNFNVSIFNNIAPDQEFFNDLFKTLPTIFSILGLFLVYSIYTLKVKNSHRMYRKYILLSYLYCKKFFADAFNNLYIYLPSAKFSLNITYKLIDQGFLEQFGSTGIYNFLETIFKNLVNLETTLLIYRLLLSFIFSLGISLALFFNISIIFIILFLIMSLVFINNVDNYVYPHQLTELSYIFSFDSGANHLNFSLIKTHTIMNNLTKRKSSFFLQVRVVVFVYILFLYGIALIIWKTISSLPWIGRYLRDPQTNFLIQGTLAAFFPEYVPMIFFGIYFYAYRLELIFASFDLDSILKSSTISFIQQLRRSTSRISRLIGRTSAFGFMGGAPKMPKGPLGGMAIWGTVVVTGIAITQYRHYRSDLIQAQTELELIKMQTQIELTRIRLDAQNKAYQTHTEAFNKRPWWGKEPPQPPKF